MQAIAYCLGFNQVLAPAYHSKANLVERKGKEQDIKAQLAVLTAD